MASDMKVLRNSTYLTNAVVTVYTCPDNTTTLIMAAKLTSVNGNKKATVHIVPFGGTASAENAYISDQTIGNNDTYLCPELVGRILKPGDFIAAIATANTSITFAAHGREVVG